MPQEVRVCLHSVAPPRPLPNSETYQGVLTMFSEELDSKQQLAQQREAVNGINLCGDMGGTQYREALWRSEDNLQELLLSFCHMGSRY